MAWKFLEGRIAGVPDVVKDTIQNFSLTQKKRVEFALLLFFLLGELKKIWRSPKILTFWRFEKETFFSETETYFDLVKNRKLSKFK